MTEEKMEYKGEYDNPFTDVELRLQVKAPEERAKGSEFSWYGFHDGDGKGNQNGNIWKFRMLFDHPGQWQVRAGFYEPGPGELIGQTKTFTYQVSREKYKGENGHVRIAKENPSRFEYDDGTPWIPFPMQSSSLLDVDTSTAYRWIDMHKEAGLDALTPRFHTSTQQHKALEKSNYHFLSPQGNRVLRWAQNNEGNFNADSIFDFSQFDIQKWQHSEKIIEYARDRGVNLSIWFGISGINRQYRSYGPKDYPNDTTLGEQQQLFIKYFLARWAPYTNWWHWTIDSEYEETGQGSRARVRTYASYMRELNPWKTLLTTHVLRDWSLKLAPEFDFATLQRRVIDSDVGVVDCASFITQNNMYNMPVYNSEGVWNLKTENKTRTATLAHTFAGGYSHLAHFENINPITRQEEHGSWVTVWENQNYRHKQDIIELGKLNRFFNHGPGNKIHRCLPNNSIIHTDNDVRALCLEDPGRQYFVWLPDGGTCKLNLHSYPDTFLVTAWKGNNLNYPIANYTVVGGEKVKLVAPKQGGGNDYIFSLTSQSLSPPVIQILTNTLSPVVMNKKYSAVIDIRDASGDIKWNLKGELPEGLTFQNGSIKGVAENVGEYHFQIMAEDEKDTSIKQYSLTVLEKDTPAPLIYWEGIDKNEKSACYTVKWFTDIPSSSRVQWGTEKGKYTGESGVVEQNVTKHEVTIGKLPEKTEVVYVLIISATEDGRTSLKEESFNL
ncbi:MAG: DUF5060 domain-containing protein [Bacteroidetes bacterium]|jgi:hypothetical protein|nr:DUF5060 domain-containing protein [Bacteroidota bacterium]